MSVINLPNKYLSVIWNEKPSASTMQDEIIFISDIGPSGSFFISNGTRWSPLGGSCILTSNNVGMSSTGYVGEQLITFVKIPAGLMSSNGQLEITHLTLLTNNANVKRLRIRHSDTPTTGVGASYFSASLASTRSCYAYTYIRNDNATNVQYGHSAGGTSGFGSSGIAGTTGSLDTNLDSYITFNGENADAGDNVKLESFIVNYIEG